MDSGSYLERVKSEIQLVEDELWNICIRGQIVENRQGIVVCKGYIVDNGLHRIGNEAKIGDDIYWKVYSGRYILEDRY